MDGSTPLRGWRRWTIAGILTLVSLNAVAAGVAFVAQPSGDALGISQDRLAGSPFPDYLVPGLLLLALGLLYGFAALREARGMRDAWFWAGLSGGAMIVWIVVQAAMMGYDRHPVQTALQATIVLAGIATGLLALTQMREVRPARRSAA